MGACSSLLAAGSGAWFHPAIGVLKRFEAGSYSQISQQDGDDETTSLTDEKPLLDVNKFITILSHDTV